MLEPRQIAKMLGSRTDPLFDRGQGSGGFYLPPCVSLSLPSLFLIATGKEKHKANQGGGDQIGERERWHGMLIGEQAVF
jgi:hypothetical protein